MHPSEKLTFTFPLSLQQLEIVSSPESAREELMGQVLVTEIDRTAISYRLHLQKEHYCYLRCRWNSCPAVLRYRFQPEQQHWLLTSAKCTHRHGLPKTRSQQFQAVRGYLQQLSGLPSGPVLRQVVCQQFNVTAKQYYYLLSQCRHQPVGIPQLTDWLEERGYEVFLSEEERPSWQPPELLVAASQQMKQLFHDYGDLVSFDLSFNLIKDSHPSSKKWKVGVFLGTSFSKRMVPLALVATLQDTKEAYCQLLQTFFRAMGGQPKVLVTDEEKAIGAALAQLRTRGDWNGLHLLDAFHILHNVRKKLDRKEDIVFFSRLLHAPTQPEFDRRLSELRAQLPPSHNYIIEKFLAGRRGYCFSQIESSFISFTSSSSPNQALHSHFKRLQSSEKEFSITIRNLAGFLDKLVHQCHRFEQDRTPYQRILDLPELGVLRAVLSKPIMVQLIRQVAKSMRLESGDSQHNHMAILDHRNHFIVRKREELWECHCGILEKTQLPCRHVLRAVISRGDSILSHVPTRWLAKQDPQEMEAKQENQKVRPPSKRGRERGSKRRLIF